jgi:hypothetical protein
MEIIRLFKSFSSFFHRIATRFQIEDLPDQNLAQIDMNYLNSHVRLSAIRYINDQNLLVEIADTDKDMIVRQAAIRKLSDQNLLAKFTGLEYDLRIRKRAVNALNDTILLSEIVKNEKDDWVRWVAVMNSNFNDQKILAEIAVFDIDPRVREAALNKLQDKPLQVNLNSTDDNLRA